MCNYTTSMCKRRETRDPMAPITSQLTSPHARSTRRRGRVMIGTLTLTVALLLALGVTHPSNLAAGNPGVSDWPMWGGTPDRNMVSNMKGLPAEWDVKAKKNVKWVPKLGSQSYGNPVVAGGMVFVGT